MQPLNVKHSPRKYYRAITYHLPVNLDNVNIDPLGKTLAIIITPIPVAIRNLWKIQDGQSVMWFDHNGDIVLVPSTPWRKGKLR